MCKHFNDLSTKVDFSSSYFIVKKEIINLYLKKCNSSSYIGAIRRITYDSFKN